ncbi:MAG: FHA domain-containing protein, partial [Clostridium butyricum]|nr:FHA domain-containing protein [Clostridium butyricum]
MYENNSIKKKLYISMQMINVLIAVIMTLLCIIAYYTIEYTYARALIIGVVIVLGTICLINIYIKFQAKNKPRDFSRIKTVEL